MLYHYAYTLSTAKTDELTSHQKKLLACFAQGGLLSITDENAKDIDCLVESRRLKIGTGCSYLLAVIDCLTGCMFTPVRNKSQDILPHYSKCYGDVLEQKYINIHDFISCQAHPCATEAAVILLDLIKGGLLEPVHVK